MSATVGRKTYQTTHHFTRSRRWGCREGGGVKSTRAPLFGIDALIDAIDAPNNPMLCLSCVRANPYGNHNTKGNNTMYLNGFSVKVLGGNETPGGYVEMTHGKTYKLYLRNNLNNLRCDARVEIDGKHVGTFRIPAGGQIKLERPVHDEGLFTFYKLGSAEARQSQLDSGSPDIGLIKVTFIPEVPQVTYVYTSVAPAQMIWRHPKTPGNPDAPIFTTTAMYNCATAGTASFASPPTTLTSYSAGGTGLSGHSDQDFVPADSITPDYSRETTIHLRLVCKDDSNTPRPLTAYSTPIPPRIG
jgi:hypothetical protein